MTASASVNDIELERFVLFNYKHLYKTDKQIKEIKSIDDGTAIDLFSSVLEFNITESLLSPYMEMTVAVKNSLALSSVMPIIGEELIHVSFRTPSVEPDKFTYEPIDIVMRVTGMTDFMMVGDREETFLLHLKSRHFIKNKETRINRAFKNLPIEAMVYNCISDIGMDTNRFIPDSTVGTHHFVIPNWTPLDTIFFLCGEAQSTVYPNSSNFIFYEDHAGSYFTPIETILSKNGYDVEYYVTEQSLNFNVTENALDNAIKNVSKNPEEFRYIQAISYDRKFDLEKSYLEGMYTNQTLYIDPLTQTFKATKVNGKSHFDYNKDFDNTIKTNEKNSYKMISDKKNFDSAKPSHTRFLITNKEQTPDFGTFPRKRHDFLPTSISSIAQLSHIQCTILVPGDSDRKPGDFVKFNAPEFGATDDIIDKVNRFFKGRWVVLDVKHLVNRNDAYKTVLSLGKNAFEEEISELSVSEGFVSA